MAIAVGAPIDVADFTSVAALTSDVNLAASSTTLQAVTGLAVPVLANAAYIVDLWIGAKNAAGTTEDIQFGASFPSGAGLRMGMIAGTTGGVTGNNATDVYIPFADWTSGTATFFAVGLSTTFTSAVLRGVLRTGANAGTLQIMAAQNTSGTNVSTVLSGSNLLLTRIG